MNQNLKSLKRDLADFPSTVMITVKRTDLSHLISRYERMMKENKEKRE